MIRDSIPLLLVGFLALFYGGCASVGLGYADCEEQVWRNDLRFYGGVSGASAMGNNFVRNNLDRRAFDEQVEACNSEPYAKLRRALKEIREHYEVPENVRFVVQTEDHPANDQYSVLFANVEPDHHTINIYPAGLDQDWLSFKATIVHELEHVKLHEQGLHSNNYCTRTMHEALARKAELRFIRDSEGWLRIFTENPYVRVDYENKKREAEAMCYVPWALDTFERWENEL